MEWQSQNITTAVHAWLSAATVGHCGETSDRGDCETGNFGSFGFRTGRHLEWADAAQRCLQKCFKCSRCRYMTISPAYKDCSWYHVCELSGRDMAFKSGAVASGVSPLQRGATWKEKTSCAIKKTERSTMRFDWRVRGRWVVEKVTKLRSCVARWIAASTSSFKELCTNTDRRFLFQSFITVRKCPTKCLAGEEICRQLRAPHTRQPRR